MVNIGSYLPSAQFSGTVGSILASGLLVGGAYFYTKHEAPPSTSITAAPIINADDVAWQAALADIQGSAGIEAPQAPDQKTVATLLEGVQGDNITATIGKTLLVGLTNAKAQGLGADIPTQESLVRNAQELLPDVDKTTYSSGDLKIVPQTPASLHSYGNNFLTTITSHPHASLQVTYFAVGLATDKADPNELKALDVVEKEYRAIVRELKALSVPQTLAPLHLQAINDFEAIADTYTDIGAVLTDPLRGIAGLKRYDSLIGEVTRVLTNIAQALNKNGIIFNADEPGSSWSVFLST